MAIIISQSKKETKTNQNLFDKKNEDLNIFKELLFSLGPSVFLDTSNNDLLSPEELQNIKINFLIKKLKLSDSQDLDSRFSEATRQFIKSGIEQKRAFFYFFIVKYFEKDDLFVKNDHINITSKHLQEIINQFQQLKDLSFKSETKLIDFGENLIQHQKNLDKDIVKIIDENFSSLF